MIHPLQNHFTLWNVNSTQGLLQIFRATRLETWVPGLGGQALLLQQALDVRLPDILGLVGIQSKEFLENII